MFLSTRKPEAIYKFIVTSCKENIENNLKKKLKFEEFKIEKFPKIDYLIFVIYFIFSLKIFSKQKRLNLKFGNIEIGRFVTAQTFNNFASYNSKVFFYFYYIKNLIKAGKLLNSAMKYYKKNVKAIYIDHCGYINGVLYSFFSYTNTIIYSNNFPQTIYKIDFKNSNNKFYQKYENSLIIHQKKNLKKNELSKCKFVLKSIFSKPNKLKHMLKTKYVKLPDINFKKFDYVIYTHSFTDGQLWYGLDEFENTLDWIKFTLNNLKDKNKNILIKAHPNFYEKTLGVLSESDKIIYSNLKNEFKNNKNFYFLDRSVFNYELLKRLKKECVLISHHGTVILEGANIGFKTISSKANFFNKKFKVSNLWSTKREYKNLLNKSFKGINYPLREDFYSLIYQVYINEFSYSGKKFWQNIIATQMGISIEKYKEKVESFQGINNSIEKMKYFSLISGKKFKQTIKKLNQNIICLNFEKY
jgi:hypothetical protein